MKELKIRPWNLYICRYRYNELNTLEIPYILFKLKTILYSAAFYFLETLSQKNADAISQDNGINNIFLTVILII